MTSLSLSPLPDFGLPEPISALGRIAFDFQWSWDFETQKLFQQIDPQGWKLRKNPVQILCENSTALGKKAEDEAFVRAVQAAENRLAQYHAQPSPQAHAPKVAYFCAEYGLHETFAQYSGGLGILAGDHTKEASDMGLPFIGVGLFYRRGFFFQNITGAGRQEHQFGWFWPEKSPVRSVLDAHGQPLKLSLPLPGRTLWFSVFALQVGRVWQILLDTDMEENLPQDRPITSQLYTSGREMRLLQEFVLGAGGVRALRAIGFEPDVWHMNEGHSALLVAERLREMGSEGKSLEEALNQIRQSSILTIHTPVPAGNERFAASLVAPVMDSLLAGSNVEPDSVMELALDLVADASVFDMTALALRSTRAANGVSLLHGETAHETWHRVHGKALFGLTNGVHMPTWLGPSFRSLLAENGHEIGHGEPLGVAKKGTHVLRQASNLSSEHVWSAHLEQKHQLIRVATERLISQAARHGDGSSRLEQLSHVLHSNAFVIGFARRFATYKRATLLFSQPQRLLKLLNHAQRPVVLLFAGKAHPADTSGQDFILKLHKLSANKRFQDRVFLLEDYDMELGRALVQGSDIWLNNPRRPLEASGTSGMKAAANGVPNVSILDGWWDEACSAPGADRNGWAIGDRTQVKSEAAQDLLDADSLFDVLENEVIPLYFDRDSSGIPQGWVEVMKESIATTIGQFSTSRMLQEYIEKMYKS